VAADAVAGTAARMENKHAAENDTDERRIGRTKTSRGIAVQCRKAESILHMPL
jgi:hypothetical protein